MDFTNVRTDSQSCPLAVRGRAAAERRGPTGRSHALQRTHPSWSPDHSLAGAGRQPGLPT